MRVLLCNRAESHLGGDMIQLRAYERELQKLGLDAIYESNWDCNMAGTNLLHMFHLNFGWTWRFYLRAQQLQIPYVISAIFYPNLFDVDVEQMTELIRNSQKTLFLSQSELEDCKKFLNYDIPPEKVAITNNGVAEVFSKEGEKYVWNKDYVMIAGRWEEGKGQRRVLEACKELEIPVVAIGPLGDDNYRESCKKDFPEAFISDALPQDKLAEYYRGAKVYICASETERHNLCLMEAAACGCNLVSSPFNRGNEWYGKRLTVANSFHKAELQEAILKEYRKKRSASFAKKIPHWSDVARQIKTIYETL